MATVFMTLYGKEGLRELALQNLSKAHYLGGKLKPRFSGPYFNEFVAMPQRAPPTKSIGKLLDRRRSSAACRSIASIRNSRAAMLLCATEMSKRSDMDAVVIGVSIMIKKVRKHIVQNEPLIFERSSPGKNGYQLPALDVPAVDPAEALGAQNVRGEIEGFPEVSEVDVIRHFTRLSTWNYAIDLGHVSARLLHHEVQPARQRAGGAARRTGLGASVSAGGALAGRDGSDARIWKTRCSKSPAWTPSRCSRPPARMAS